MDGYIRLYGSNGTIQIDGFNYEGISMTVRQRLPGGMAEETEHDNRKDPSQFIVESDYFSRCILDNKEPGPNGEEGLRDMQHIASIYAAAKRA